MRFTTHVILLASAILMCQLVAGRSVGKGKSKERPGGKNQKTDPIDEVIRKASESGKSSFDFQWNPLKHLALVEGDILMKQDEWVKSHGSERVKRTAGIIPTVWQARWPTNTVKYSIMMDDFDAADLETINKAFASWEHYTCVKFEEATLGDMDRVLIHNARGCYSYVGMIGGTQVLGLANGCRYVRIVLHELGHALGVHHEQTRPNRNKYVTIKYENIISGVANNFQRYTWDTIMKMKIRYDYYSIMHYSGRAFSSNGENTIVTKDTSVQETIGTSPDLSFKDMETMNYMYNCNAHCESKKCPGKGFQGRDCECWCPVDGDPFNVTYCKRRVRKKGDIGKPGSRVMPTAPPPADCQNDPAYDANCAEMAIKERCDEEDVKVWCKRTCVLCD